MTHEGLFAPFSVSLFFIFDQQYLYFIAHFYDIIQFSHLQMIGLDLWRSSKF